jgi:hypothetical protein
MSGVLALPRLLARPVVLWTLFPLFWAVAIPLMNAFDAGASPGALWAGSAPEAARGPVWQFIVLIPAVIGFSMAIVRLELQHALISWTLPDLSRRLLAGTLAIAAPLAAAAAFLAARNAPAGGETLHGAAAFALALLWFALAATAWDYAFPRGARWVALLLVVLAALRPSIMLAVAEAGGWAVAAAAIAAAALLFALQFSRGLARRRYFRWSPAATGRADLYWAERASSPRRWTGALTDDGLASWLRAAAFSQSRMPLAVRYLMMGMVAAIAAYLVNNAAMILIMGGTFFGQPGLRLPPGLRYPLSRERRADLSTAGVFIDAALFTVVVTASLLTLRWFNMPVPAWLADETSRVGWGAAIAMTLAWAPLVQWSHVIWPATPARHGAFDWRRLLLMLAYVVPALVSTHLVTGLDPLPLAALTTTMVSVGYGVFWMAARRHFARADLLNA